jgi:hypothetical protein
MQHLDSSARGLVRRWLLIGISLSTHFPLSDAHWPSSLVPPPAFIRSVPSAVIV